MAASKYVVFPRKEFEAWHDRHGHRLQDEHPPLPIPDAVVLRQQDVFAPAALDSYANAILVAVSLAQPGDTTRSLQKLADFFHEKAAESWLMHRKIPD